jgi:hypothetical protein
VRLRSADGQDVVGADQPEPDPVLEVRALRQPLEALRVGRVARVRRRVRDA